MALGEEFFFLAACCNQIEEWLSSRAGALAVTAVLFGLVDLPFGGSSQLALGTDRRPDGWLLAGARAIRPAHLRAGMVTHALAVTAWRAFLQSL